MGNSFGSKAELLLDLAMEESDDESMAEAGQELKTIGEQIRAFTLDLMLDGEDDRNNAIISINAGAGGTDLG